VAFWGTKRREAPQPPGDLIAGLGPGDYHEIGRHTLGLIERMAGVRARDRVLDVGCGLGRIAWPLSERLGRRGSYVGLDVAQAYTDWCRDHLGLDPRRFTFHHADIRSSLYNPDGEIEPEGFVFPWSDGSFDLAIATSLFTHLMPDAAAHYLAEIARVLAPGGRVFASFFLLDPRGREAAATGATYPTFGVPMEHGLLHDPAVPESAVAYDPEWLGGRLTAANLEVIGVHAGKWKDPLGLDYQDVVVASRS
jgi:SAM-dependent methyltransferase